LHNTLRLLQGTISDRRPEEGWQEQSKAHDFSPAAFTPGLRDLLIRLLKSEVIYAH
jgi:hypothetical protein